MSHHKPQFIITPAGGLSAPDLPELWTYRELIGFLAWRDVTIRYKQTALGALWAVLQPVLMAAVFTVIFGKLAKVSSDGVPYVLFGFASALCWQYFASALSNSSGSLLNNSTFLTKIYFPRLVIPIASVLPACLDFAIAFVLLLIIMPFMHVHVQPALLFLPAFCFLALACAVGMGLWCSALSIEYRDVKHVLPFAIQLLLFLSPVAYPASMVPRAWQGLYSINPLVGIIEGFRWCLLGTAAPTGEMLILSVSITLLLLISGALYFCRMERNFADVI